MTCTGCRWLDVLEGNPHCSLAGEVPCLVLTSCPCTEDRIAVGGGLRAILDAYHAQNA